MGIGLEESQIKEQLGHLKSMFVRLGVLHEAQALQLEMYPLAAFTHALSSTCEIDTENKLVRFKINTSLSSLPKGKKHDAAMKKITEMVRMILWDDSRVLFDFNCVGKKK